MGLSSCPGCSEPVSTEAISCPHCGHPLKSTPDTAPQKKGTHVPTWLALLLIPIGVIVLILVFMSFLSGRYAIRMNPAGIRLERTLLEEPSLRIAACRQYSFPFSLNSQANIKIEVFDAFGQNIRAQLLKEGKAVWDSGVVKSATQQMDVGPGSYNLVIINGNLLEEKVVKVKVVATGLY